MILKIYHARLVVANVHHESFKKLVKSPLPGKFIKARSSIVVIGIACLFSTAVGSTCSNKGSKASHQ